MKIAIISTSATIGGAAIASSRLADALSRQGQEVAMITLDGRSRLPFLAERAEIFARNGLSRTNLFKVSTAAFGLPVASLPEVREADAVLLGWFNQGLLSLGGLASLGKPIVWTMHDMWAFTGIFHNSLGCEVFKA
ncbi:MAG: glycosyltransferase, partial [Muribaculaceae bacterium]|nr:glycosyltransferase [Muribaculaceae bacterium]